MKSMSVLIVFVILSTTKSISASKSNPDHIFEIKSIEKNDTYCFIGDIDATLTYSSNGKVEEFEINSNSIKFSKKSPDNKCDKKVTEVNFSVKKPKSAASLRVQMQFFRKDDDNVEMESLSLQILGLSKKIALAANPEELSRRFHVHAININKVEKLSYSCESDYKIDLEVVSNNEGSSKGIEISEKNELTVAKGSNLTVVARLGSDAKRDSAQLVLHSFQWQAFSKVDKDSKKYGPPLRCPEDEVLHGSTVAIAGACFGGVTVAILVGSVVGRAKFRLVEKS